MQTLYTLSTSEGSITRDQALQVLNNHLDQSRQLFIFLIYTLVETARYAETDARVRSSRHLPTAEDLQVNTKIAGNELMWQIRELPSFQAAVKEVKTERLLPEDWVRKLYQSLTESPVYTSYIREPLRSKKQEKDILEYIFTDILLPNDDFTAFVEEHFVHWDDDSEMMNLLLLNFLHKPQSYNFQQFITPEKMQYGRDLLLAVLDKEAQCSELIRSKLQNWDPERTAALDMILMRMGICEFLYFETIPPKVTINEYIDLAKEYSTPQSGHFVNGILDSIHKELAAADKLHKVNFKKPS
ncbi:MAG TPA: transcription antitermination factor NusB [Lacibacter sp.]|nr:transcription antitermination factor NusB [Lacibacter sp.]